VSVIDCLMIVKTAMGRYRALSWRLSPGCSCSWPHRRLGLRLEFEFLLLRVGSMSAHARWR
jgi:hypothetical protein